LYAYLEGILIEKHPTAVILEVGGIGYELIIPLSTSHSLPALQEKVKLLTYFHVREDLQQFFGFSSEGERALFKLLLTVSGIGPKLAITILSGLASDDLIRAIQDQDLESLNAISGIGKKTAERILLELKGKVPTALSEKARVASSLGEETLSDALSALISLGYKRPNAEKAVKKVLQKEKNISVEDLIRESLKVI